MTLDSFVKVAAANASKWGAAVKAEKKAVTTKSRIWLELAIAKSKGMTAEEHYKVLPSVYTETVTLPSFKAIWSLSLRILGACTERGIDPIELVTERGSLDACKAYLFPAPIVEPSKPAPQVEKVVPEDKVIAVREAASVAVTVDPSQVETQILAVASNLPTDRLAALVASLQGILAERQPKAA